jgi:hypothetical protein
MTNISIIIINQSINLPPIYLISCFLKINPPIPEHITRLDKATAVVIPISTACGWGIEVGEKSISSKILPQELFPIIEPSIRIKNMLKAIVPPIFLIKNAIIKNIDP